MADHNQRSGSLEGIAAAAIEKRIFVVRERQVMCVPRVPVSLIFSREAEGVSFQGELVALDLPRDIFDPPSAAFCRGNLTS